MSLDTASRSGPGNTGEDAGVHKHATTLEALPAAARAGRYFAAAWGAPEAPPWPEATLTPTAAHGD